jgi:hypothetical protein
MKKALITGITGQDGSYLAELLLDKGYEVHGIVRRASTFNTSRLDHLYKDPLVDDTKLYLHYGDLADAVQLVKLLYALQPDEIYNLGAQSHVRVSYDIPEYTGDVVGLGAGTDFGSDSGSRARLKKFAIIRHHLRRCTVKFKRFLRWKTLPFGPVRPMLVLKFMPIG